MKGIRGFYRQCGTFFCQNDVYSTIWQNNYPKQDKEWILGTVEHNLRARARMEESKFIVILVAFVGEGS
jgi:hypothetical protein